MSKFLFVLSVVLSGATQAQAELLSGCAMDNGNLIHKVDLVAGGLIGRFDFPTFKDLEEDSTGQTRSVNAPLTNDSIFSSSLPFLKEKKKFLEKVFGPKRSLNVNFDFCEFQQSEYKKFSARFCIKEGPFEVNGVSLKRLEFSIQNQVRTSLVGSQGQVAQTDVVYVDLLFTTVANSSGVVKKYNSSFTYYPDGDSIQCTLN